MSFPIARSRGASSDVVGCFNNLSRDASVEKGLCEEAIKLSSVLCLQFAHCRPSDTPLFTLLGVVGELRVLPLSCGVLTSLSDPQVRQVSVEAAAAELRRLSRKWEMS